MRGLVQGLDRALLWLESSIVGVGVAGIALISIVNVVARNLGGGGLPFAEEASQACMLWITFAGLGLAARQARHIRMAAFYDQLRHRARRWAWMAIAAGTSLLLLLLTVLAVRYVIQAQSIGAVTPALRVPLWWVYLIVPAGLALGALEYALTWVRNLGSTQVYVSFDRTEPPVGPDSEPAP